MAKFDFGWSAVCSGSLLFGCVDLAGPIPGTAGTATTNPVAPAPSTTPGTPAGSVPAGTGDLDLVSFNQDVHPILVARCGGCHGVAADGLPGHGAAAADEAFTAVRGMLKGEPVYQRILARASGADPAGYMPPPYAGCDGPLGAPGCLSEDEFDLIALWVEQGASRR